MKMGFEKETVLEGRLFDIANQEEFDIAINNDDYGSHDDQKGSYIEPGKYLLLRNFYPCGRGCCSRIQHELIDKDEIIYRTNNEIRVLEQQIKKLEDFRSQFI